MTKLFWWDKFATHCLKGKLLHVCSSNRRARLPRWNSRKRRQTLSHPLEATSPRYFDNLMYNKTSFMMLVVAPLVHLINPILRGFVDSVRLFWVCFCCKNKTFSSPWAVSPLLLPACRWAGMLKVLWPRWWLWASYCLKLAGWRDYSVLKQ